MFPLSISNIQMFRFLSALCLLLAANLAFAGSYERKDVTFSSQGLKCAAWYYVAVDIMKNGDTVFQVYEGMHKTTVKEGALGS